MRFAGLYLRSRLAGHMAAYLLGVALLGWLGTRLFQTLVPVPVVAPLAAACLMGLSIRSPFGEIETTTSRPLPVLRLGHLAGLLAYGAVTLSFATPQWGMDQADWLFARNLLGFTGLSLLSARVLGSGSSWVPPFAYGAIVLIAGRDVRGEWTGWVWPTQPIEDVPSAFVASVLLAAGLIVACLTGAREIPGEE